MIHDDDDDGDDDDDSDSSVAQYSIFIVYYSKVKYSIVEQQSRTGITQSIYIFL